jgi:hypothetical protein
MTEEEVTTIRVYASLLGRLLGVRLDRTPLGGAV